MSKIIDAIIAERLRQGTLTNVQGVEPSNTKNDYIAYITAYVGRAANKCKRNEREGQDFRTNLVKAAALCVAAIEKFDEDES